MLSNNKRINYWTALISVILIFFRNLNSIPVALTYINYSCSYAIAFTGSEILVCKMYCKSHWREMLVFAKVLFKWRSYRGTFVYFWYLNHKLYLYIAMDFIDLLTFSARFVFWCICRMLAWWVKTENKNKYSMLIHKGYYLFSLLIILLWKHLLDAIVL